MAEAVRPTILLVEDERSIAEPFASALAREGFEPVIAATAKAALELFHRHDPTLVLLDIALPDGDGREVCRELRRESAVPIIMLTARGTETDRVVGLELGADDYVVKPFSSAEVIARIRAVLRRSRHEATPEPSTTRRLTSRARSSTCSRDSCATPAASSRART
jgi:two-component system response regulator RegX3